MSSCSFASYLSMRTSSSSSSTTSSSGGPVVVASQSASTTFHPHPHHSHHFSASNIPASISPFDLSDPSPAPVSASPHKRQRNTSPDHSAASSASTLRAEAKSYFGFSAPPSLSLPPTSSPESTPTVPRSILCTSSSPISSACSSPFTSPPCSRPLSRRSSTSKSVRFARCTNASVFPTHSTAEYDRSPIIPTCESESLELKRNADDDDGGWVQCHVREKERKEAAANALASGPQLPKHSPAMENPVEGVRGLIEGGFFVGDSADRAGAHPAILQSAATAAALEHATNVATALSISTVVPIPEAEDEDDSIDFQTHHHDDAGGDDHVMVDDSTESASTSDHEQVPRLVRTGSLSDEDESSADDHSMPPSSASEAELSPELEPRVRSGSYSSGGEGEDSGAESEAKEKRRAECRARFGLVGLGKFTRQDVFGCYDSLSGF